LPGLIGGIGSAVGFSVTAEACAHPVGSGSPNGGTICLHEGATVAGPVDPVYWTGGIYAGGSQLYDWHFRVLDDKGNCAVEQSLSFRVGEGNSLQCPPGFDEFVRSDGNEYLCARPRYCPNCENGNPIRLGSNEKRAHETDFVGAGPFPLRILRSYGHQAAGAALGQSPSDLAFPMGRGWRTEYHKAVFVYTAPLASLVTLRRETGDNYTFKLDPATFAITPMAYERGKLERLTDGSGALTGWRYTTEDESVELYDAAGRLVSITNASGLSHTVAYDTSNRVDTVTDTFGRQLKFHYDANGRIDSITAPGAQVYAYSYADNGALASVTYPDQTVRQYLYEAPTMPFGITGIIDERGIRQSTYTYNTSTGVAASTELAGGVYKYQVSGGSVTDPLGTTRSYGFVQRSSANAYFLGELDQPSLTFVGGYTSKVYTPDANGNTIKYTDDLNNVTTYVYDLTRNLETQRVEAFNTAVARTISTQWHPTRRLRKTVAEPLRITTYSYNGEAGVSCAPAGASTALLCTKTVQATTDTTGTSAFTATAVGSPRIWSYTYDANGQILTVDGPRTDVSDVTTMTYDATGNLATVTNALGQVTQYTDYDPAGRLLRTVDPAGVETLLDYNERGWLRHRQVGSAANGHEITTYDYDNTGSLAKVTMPDGSYVQYTYDDARRLTDVQDGLGNRVHYTLDNMGNRTEEQAYDTQGSLVRDHTRVIDILNRIAQEIGGTSPSTQVTTNVYDDDSNLKSVTDPLAHVTTNKYDALNRITQVIDPFNGSAAPTKYEYDNRDQLTKVTDPRGLATTYAINGHGERLSETSPNTGITTFTYDAASNVKTKLDARGMQATYQYDALNRVILVTYPDQSVTYTYDSCTNGTGRLCTITDRAGITSYAYDLWGRVTSKTQTVGTLVQSVAYSYNASGQLSTITLPSAAVVQYGYSNNRPVFVTVNGTTVLDTVAYEPFGPNGGWRWGNSTSSVPNFHVRLVDKDFRVTSVTSDLPAGTSAAHAFDREFGWDAASRILSITDIADSTLNATYGYDSLDRLASATQGSNAWTYAYDGDGNRKTSTVNSAQTTYSYFPATGRLQALTGARAKTYAYDTAGNMATDGSSTWTYAGDNRPSLIVAGATTVQVDINALGQRVRKTAGGTVTRFMYDEAGRQLGEYADDGSLVEETVWLNDLPVAVVKPQPATPVEQIVDDTSAGFSTTGPWTSSTSVAGYLGTDYLVHAPGANAVGDIIVDNTDAGFTTTGTWTASTAVGGYLGTNYAVHAANGAPPSASVVDNTDAATTAVGTWTASTSVAGYLGTNYQVHAAGTGTNTFTWNVPVANAGTYQVYARWTAYPNRATNAPFTIATSAGPQSVVVNQQASASGSWNLLGTWSFDAGTAAVTLSDAANGYVIADAVMLVPPGAAPNTASWSASLPNAGPWRVYARWAQYPNRATNATYVVQADVGPVPVVVDQQAGGGAWVMLGEYVFSSGVGRVDITDQANGYVVADAVKFEPPGAALEAATWTPQLTQPARFDVYARWTQYANRSATATYTVTHQAGTTSIVENQQTGGGTWTLLGTFTFAPGQGVRLEASDGGYVIADAVRFTPSATQPSSGGIYYVHADQLGTPRMITRPADNAIVWRWDNTEPFGDSQANEDPSGLGSFAFDLRFPGQTHDAETSTNYNYFRDYDPSIGRYVESDPIGLEGGINVYEYAGGNSLFWIDPDGRRFEPGADLNPAYRWHPEPGDKYPGKLNGQCLLICLALKMTLGIGLSEGAGATTGPLTSLGQSKIAGVIGWGKAFGRTPAMSLISLGGAMEFCERRCPDRGICPVDYNSPARSDYPKLPPISSYGRR
jgi:RHS repeat-associated protein